MTICSNIIVALLNYISINSFCDGEGMCNETYAKRLQVRQAIADTPILAS